jgi:probable HAF family extracellular repeat protein
MKSSTLVRAGFLLLLTVAVSVCSAQTYTMIDLGTAPGDGFAVPSAINASAQVTGAAGPGGNSGNSHVFIYRNGKFTNLGTLGGTSGIGNGINASGQVAGYSTNAEGLIEPLFQKATRWLISVTWAADRP